MMRIFLKQIGVYRVIGAGALLTVLSAAGCIEQETPAQPSIPAVQIQSTQPNLSQSEKSTSKPLVTTTQEPVHQQVPAQAQQQPKPLPAEIKEIPLPGWPEATEQTHPWTRWWWMGSAVDKESLTAALTAYHQAGIGGVEICPIYGVKGYEEKFKDFLSPEWMDVLEHTLREGKRIGIGVDLTLGTGWPFGGPMVTPEIASSSVVLKQYTFEDGKLTERLPKEKLQYLLAVSDAGKRIDITDKVQDGQLAWEAPAGVWTLYAVAVKNPVQKVKRAAPGGEGYVLDPYSVAAMNAYLAVFDKAFDGYQGPMPRAYFHDSFEYYGATWTTNFFDEFKTRRGYDLRQFIEALFGDGSEDIVGRVQCDYHNTINDLHLDYIRRWTQWCHDKDGLSRNQAHGAPGNLVDIYAAADIPETEIFRVVEEQQIPMLKLSSSAAHLKGRTLASSESFTWLKEHFQTAPADLKVATDFLFLTGVNHIFFHGIPYSPTEAEWPGWQFYASVNFGPGGGLWHDLPAYNAYVTRCQSILQTGKPDNDVLLYLPIYDFWQKKEPLHMAFTVHNQDEWLYPSAFYRAAMFLWKNGYTYDAVTDDFLADATCRDGKVVINGGEYAVIVVPHCVFMQPEALEKLLTLANEGATILFQDALPRDVPGMSNLMLRRLELQRSLKQIVPNLADIESGQDRLPAAYLEMRAGNGKIVVSDLDTMLKKASVPREPAMDAGIRFVRRRGENGYHYFFVNRSKQAFDGWMTLGKPAYSAVLMDPLHEEQVGCAAVQQEDNQPQVYLQLQPGQSIILRTFSQEKVTGAGWDYTEKGGNAEVIKGTWNVEFVKGGPVLPEGFQTTTLASWTQRDDEEAKRFFGTARYTIEFSAPTEQADGWLLDLGDVRESAHVSLNGVSLGTLWAKPFVVHIEKAFLKAGNNTLQIDVTNSAANRIRDLDRRGVNWKYFYDINVVNVNYKPLDASDWPLFESGLLGPVQLQPLKFVSLKDAVKKKSDEHATLFIIGDSTVHNSQPGIAGWGDVIGDYFDPLKVTVRNYARGGRSSRTFLTEGSWERVKAQIKPGDVVMMQFGHNDAGLLDTGRARGSLQGLGDRTQDVTIQSTGQPEVVHTYGWYLEKYINETKAIGGIPIVLSPVPRSKWQDGKVVRADVDYGKWAKETARKNGAFFIDLNQLVAEQYETLGQEKVNEQFFLVDHTHTTQAGAKLNVEEVLKGLDELDNCPLTAYLTNIKKKLNPTSLRCEYRVDPMGIDVPAPRLSWMIESGQRNVMQSAYRILAASSPEVLSQDVGDLWDSGIVHSDRTVAVLYAGNPLQSSQAVFWKVKIWDQNQTVSPWSSVARWTMGLLDASDWKAQWITAPALAKTQADEPSESLKEAYQSLLLRHQFTVKNGLRRAFCYVCGLGQYEMTVNGKPVTDDLLTPGWTQYNKTCLYDTRDVTPLLREGDNAVGLLLGNGMYNVVGGRYVKFKGSFGPLKAIVQLRLEYDDGSVDVIGTDPQWNVHSGPITFSCVYGGEDYDARLEPDGWNQADFDDSQWQSACVVDGPGGTLKGLSASALPIKTFETFNPVSQNVISPGVTVYDLGQNASFMIHTKVNGSAGDVVRVIPAELVKQDGAVDRQSCSLGRPGYWQYTLAGGGPEEWFSKFFYHGCRYLQVELMSVEKDGPLPLLESVEGVVVQSASEPVGRFSCSNDLFNRIHALVRWAQRSNMMSILTDCPHREKLGWLEQAYLNGPSLRYEFDLSCMFSKIMNDMTDCQLENGLVPNIAPEYVVFPEDFRDSPEWGSAYIVVPWQQYQWTGDPQLFEQHYNDMKRYIAYLDSRAQDNIVSHGLGDWYDIGPKPPGFAQLTPKALTATASYYYDTVILSKIAELLSKPQDAESYRRKAEDIRHSFNRKFYDSQTGQYAGGSQCGNAMALAMDMTEPQNRQTVLDAIVQDIHNRGNRVTAGDVGYRYLLRALADGGRSDVIYDMMNQSETPGYGYQLKKGATSLTEAWNARRGSSQNHFMLGQIIEWFYHDLAGIAYDPTGPGFEKIIIRPQPVGDLTWVKASYLSVHGQIRSQWQQDNKRFTLKVHIPANTTATIYVPSTSEQPNSIHIGGAVADAGYLRYENGYQIYAVGSGDYEFHTMTSN